MTNPPGNAPTPREKHSASRSFCGQPIVVRVRDLNWQPPAPTPVEETWVSSLLGEDLPENRPGESLLTGFEETDQYAAPTATVADPVQASVAQGNQSPSETPMPSYLQRGLDVRGQRRSAINGQWLNRLYLGGMAVSLLVASYWVVGGGSSDEATEEVPGDLFAETSDLDEAPPWSGLEPSLTPHEAITVQPLENDVPQIASRPQRSSTAFPQNPAEVELPTIQPAYTGLPSSPPDDYSPSWSNTNTTGKPEMAEDDYIPSFGPSSSATSRDEDYPNPSYSGGIPTGNNLPNFDANPANRTASSATPGGAMDTGGGPYPETESPGSDEGHWMFSNGRELVQRNRGSEAASDSQPESSQYTQIINGRSDDVTLPQIATPPQTMPPQMAESHNPTAPQDPNQYGFGPYSDPYADPYSQQDSVPRSASRTGLTGDIETFSGTR